MVSLEALRYEISPSLCGLMQHKGDGVRGAEIFPDLFTGSLMLVVTHELASRHELENQTFKRLLRPRVCRALLVESGDVAKQLRADRRRLMARAKDAKSAKRLPVRRRKR